MGDTNGLTLGASFHFYVDMGRLFSLHKKRAENLLGRSRQDRVRTTAALVAAALEDAGVGPVLVTRTRRIIDNLEFIRPMMPMLDRLDVEEEWFEGWVVKTDDRLTQHAANPDEGTPPHEADFLRSREFLGFEVAMRLLPATGQTHDKIKACAKAIRHGLRRPGAVHFDSHTGYDVRVGRGRAGFGVLEMQKFYSLVLAGGEAILGHVHPVSRRAGVTADLASCALHSFGPPRGRYQGLATRELTPEAQWYLQASGLDGSLEDGKEGLLGPWETLDADPKMKQQMVLGNGTYLDCTGLTRAKYLWRLRDAAELHDAFAGDGRHNPTYAPCKSISMLTGDPHGTFEETYWVQEPEDGTRMHHIVFRQGTGELRGGDDAQYPVAWAQVAVGLLRWAITVDGETFGRLIQNMRVVSQLGYGNPSQETKYLLR